MQSITTVNITVAELKAMMREAVATEVAIFKREFLKKETSDIMSRKQAAVFLQIDLSTLHRWTEDKKITAHKLCRRVYYKKTELQEIFKN